MIARHDHVRLMCVMDVIELIMHSKGEHCATGSRSDVKKKFNFMLDLYIKLRLIFIFILMGNIKWETSLCFTKKIYN